MLSRLGRCFEIMAGDIADNCQQFSEECSVVFPKIGQEIGEIPEKVADQAVGLYRDIKENWESGSILILASIGVVFIIGKTVMRIPVPPMIEKRMVAPIIGIFTVRGIALSAERKMRCG